MKTIAKRFPWTVRFIALGAVILLASYRTWSQTSGGACEQTHFESIEADSLRYLPGDTVSVSGHGFAPSCDVLMAVNLPDGTVESSTVATNAAGTLSFSYPLGPLTGDYSFQAETSDGTISLAMASFTSGIFVMTDKLDYRPGAEVMLSGRGFQAGETIDLVVSNIYPGGQPDRLFSAIADGSGAFVNIDFSPGQQDKNTTLLVTATGRSSGRSAEQVFSDATYTQLKKTTNVTGIAAVTSLTATYTASPAAGNLLVAVVGSVQSNTIGISSAGWTTAISQAGTPSQGIFYKLAGAGESTSVIADFSGASFTNTGAITVAFNGVAKTLVRTVGNWLNDGFAVGQTITTSNASNPGPFSITALNGTTITVSQTVVTVAAVATTVTGPGTTGTITIYEYSGVLATSTAAALDGTASTTGTGTPVSSGTVSTSSTDDLLIAGATANGGSTLIAMPSGTINATNPTNGFTVTAPLTGIRLGSGTQQITSQTPTRTNSAANNSTSMTITAGAFPWRGQIVAFKGKTDTTTAISVSPPSPAVAGQPVTLTAAISPSGTSGTVTFKDGATTLCAAAPVSSDTATCVTSSLSAGTHSAITATYNGDASFNPSPADTLAAYVVNAQVATDCFRSLVTPGTWSVASNWEQATPVTGACPAAAANWHTASLVPTSSAFDIDVRSGHTMTVTAANTAVALTVDGNLVINAGASLNLPAVPGVQLTVNGTMTVNGTQGGGGGNGATNPTVSINGSAVVGPTGAMNGTNTVGQFVIVNSGGSLDIQGSLGGSTSPLTISSGGQATVSGSIALASISNLQVSGTLTATGSGTISATRGNGGSVGTINSGGSMILQGTSTLTIGGVGSVSVLTGGTLDIGPTALVNGNVLAVNVGANLKIGSTAGITSSGATGNVQTGTRTFDTGANYTYAGTAAQVTGNALPATVNNLIINNSGPANVTLTSSVIATGNLALTSGDLVTGANSITEGAAATTSGTTDVVGTFIRTTPGTASLTYGNPNNVIQTSASPGAQISVVLAKSAPAGKTDAVTRNYSITPTTAAGYTASVQLHYLDSELNGNTESALELWRAATSAGPFVSQGQDARDATNNWVQKGSVAAATLNGSWTISAVTAVSTTTTVSSSANPSIYGSPVTFTATITPSAATGAVQFVVDGSSFGGPVTVSGGTAASGSTSSLTAGTHTVVANFVGTGVYTNSTGTLSPVQTVNQKSVTASVTANNKTYDGNTTATIASCSLTGVVAGDAGNVTCTAGGPNTFADRNAGNGKTVTATGITLGGTAAANYSLSSTSATTTANITALAITVTAVSSTKTYDGNTSSAGVPTVSPALISPDTSAFTQTFDTRNAGTGKTLTPSGTISDGNSGNNYVVTFAPVTTGTINALPITVTAVTASKTYDQTTTSTGVPTLSPAVISPDTATFTQAFDSKNAGARTLTASGSVTDSNSGNNYAVTFVTASGTITPRALVVTAAAANKIYDGTASAAVTLSDDRIAGDVFTASFTSASFTDKNVGAGKTVNVTGISISGTDAGNYTANTTATATASITPRALTISAVGVNKVYDGTTIATVGLTDNRIAGDVFTDGYVSAVFADKNVANGIAVSVSGISISGTDAGNYTFNTTASTTANITAKTVTAAIAASDKVYDSTTAATITSCTLAGVVAPDSVSCVATNGQFDTPSFGTGKTVTADVALSGTDAGNYSVAPTATTTANITKASLTVTGITASDKVYDRTTVATLNTASAALVGVVSGDTVTLDTSAAVGTFDDKNVGLNKAVTISGLTIGGAQAADYTLTQPSTTASITPLYLTVSGITANNKIYDATTTATLDTSLAALNGVIAPDAVTLDTSLAAGAFANKTVGTAKPVTVSGLTISGADVANYGLTQPTTSADITARTLTVSGVTANNKVYDGTTVATLNTGSAALVGIQGSDTVTLNTGSATGAFADKNVANGKPVTVSGLTISGADATNYTLSQPSASADITPKALVGSITASNKVYDGTTSATIATRTLSGVIAPDVVSYVGGTATFADKNVANGKTVTATGLSLSGGDAGNYTVNSTATASADITAKTLTVSATGVNKVYDGTTTATVTLSDDRIAGDVFTTAYASASFASKSVGTGKPVSVTGISISGTDAGNYTANTTASTTADITGRPLTISAVGISKIYDGTTVATVGLTDNRIAGDVFTDSYVSASFADKNVGVGKAVTVSGISISGVDAGNYTFNTTAATTADVTAKTVTATIAASDKTYDGTTAATITSCTLAGVVAGDAGNVSCTATNGQFSDASAGLNKTVTADVALTGSEAGNYAVAPTATTTATITKANLTVTGITASDKVYDRTTTATLNTASAALVGVVGGDTVTLDTTAAVGTFDDKNVGLNKAVAISGLTIGGAQAGDYTLTQPSTTASITPLYLTVSGITANNKIYDATTTATINTAGAVLNGAITPDVVTLDTTSATGAFGTKTVGTGKTVQISGLTIGGADAGNYLLTQPTTTADISARTLTVSGVTANNKVYDGTTVATLNTGSAALVGIQGSDTVTLNTGSATGAFADKNVGTSKPVTVSGLTILGADSGNYTVSQPSASADITPKSTTAAITASNKVYDGTTTATITACTPSGVINPDVVTCTGTAGTFDTANAGTGKTVTATVALSGADAANYVLSSTTATTTADITKANQTITFGALANKTYGDADFGVSATASSTLTGTFTASGNCTVTGSTVHITGAGSCTITAHQAGDGNYNAATDVPQSFTIAKADPTLTATGNTCTYDGNPCAGSGTATGVFSENLTPVTLAYKDVSNTLMLSAPVNAGTYSVAARFAGDANYNQKQSASATITINKAVASVTPAASSKTYGAADPAFTGTLAGFLASDNVTATYSRAAGETVAGSPYTISATLAPAGVLGNYNITYNTANFTITKANQTITFTGAPATAAYNTTFNVTASSSSGLSVTVAASGSCTVSGLTVTMTSGTGTCNLTADQAGDSNYSAAAQATQTTSASKIAPTTTFTGAPASAAFGSTFTVASTTNSSASPVYTSSGSCSNAGTTYTMTSGTGTCTSTVTWTADANYNGATLSQTTTASTIAPTTTFTGAPATAAFPSTFTVASTTNSSASPVYTSSGACSNVGTTYTMTSGTGDCTSTVTWAADANYNGATLSQTTTASKIDPTTTFTGAPASAAFGSTFTVASTTNSSASPVYTSSGSCSNAGTTYTMTSGTGTCTSTVTWAADSNYNGATKSQTTAATKINPTTTFTGAPASAAYGTSFTVASTTNGSASPVYTASGSCLNSGATYTITSGTGTCALTATWAADNNYNGTTKSQTTAATYAASTTALVSSINPSNYGQAVTFTATVTPPTSPTGSVIFYNAASGATCAAPGLSVLIDTTPLALGSAQTSTSALPTGSDAILACYSGDGNFASSSSSLTQVVNPAPVVDVNPTSLSFGNQLSGTSSSPVPVTVRNTGTAALAISSITITGPNASFFTKTTTCGASLAAGANCTISVTFSPTASGVATAVLTLTDNDKNVAGSQQFVQLTGAGTSSITGGSLFQYGIFATANGCGAITETGNGSMDSFDSTLGYAASHTNSGGNAGTNGNATLSGNAIIYGSVATPLTGTGSCSAGSMKALSTNGHATATGGLVHLDDPVYYAAPASPSPAPPTTNQGISGTCGSIAGCTNAGSKTVNLAPGQYGNLSLSGGTTAHLSKGIYNVNSLTLTGNSILMVDSGPVVVNIAGASISGNTALDLSSGSVINPTGIPINMQFYYGGSKSTKLSGHVQTYSVVYAPNSAINLSGGSDFFGSIIGNTINMSGNTALHYDRHLPSIAAGDYLWFNSAAMKVANIPAGGAKLYVTNATITINGGTPISVPNAVVNFSSTATSASTIWDVTNNRWNTIVPRATVNGNTTIHTFIDGLALLVPAGGFANGIQDVTWSAAFSTDSPGVTFQWQWGAAEYTSFSTIYGNGTNSNLLGVVPVDGADPAGTPVTYKAYLTDGATGAGGSSFTGLSVGSAGVAPTIAPASVAPSSLGFGSQTVGTTSASMPVVLTNNQATSLTISSIAVSVGSTDFAQTNNCPAVLPGGGSCTVNVTFTPTLTGARTGKITINDNANNSPQTASLTGTGQ